MTIRNPRRSRRGGCQERITFCDDQENLPEVGSIVKIGESVMNVDAGSYGVVYERYSLDEDNDEPCGIGIIFENGEYDGFSRSDLEALKVTHTGRVDQRLKDYHFENAIKLSDDWRSGMFDSVFKSK